MDGEGTSGAVRRRVTRTLRTLFRAGIAASWVGAWCTRDTSYARHSEIHPYLVVFLTGVAFTCLCIAGLTVNKAIAQRQWRDSRGRAFGGGRHRIGEPVPDVTERVDVLERKVSEVFDMMSEVCDHLGVDTSHNDETAPVLRLIQGGEAS